MDLGLVVYDGLDGTSGGYLYDRQLVDGLRRRGHDVEVVSIPRSDYRSNLLDNRDPDLAADLAALEVDVLLEDELCHPSLFGHNRASLAGTTTVSVVHHLRCSEPWPSPRESVYRAVEARYLDSVDGFVFNGTTTRRTVEDLVGPVDGVVAPPGRDHVDPDVTPEGIRRRAREDDLRATFVGSVTERKGVHALLRGLAAAPEEWTLHVVGDRTVDEAYADRIDRLVRDLELGSRVTLTGRVPDEELAERLRESHALAVPSAYEGFGIVYLEAMGYGVVPVATTAGGAAELVADGETGLLVPPEDPSAVASALATLANDRDRLARMGLAARRRYESHPTWGDSVGAVEAFLADLTSG